MRRAFLAAVLLAGAATPGLAAPSLVDRLPSDAALLGALDLEAVRKSPLLGGDMLEQPLPQQAEGFEAILRSAGLDLRRDVSQLAFAVLPGRDKQADDFAVVARGKLDPARIREAALLHGGTAAKLGDIAAVRLPRDASQPEPAYLSFVDGLAVLAGAEATRAVHARPAGATTPRMPSSIPGDAAFWLAGDLGRMEAARGAVTSSVPAMGQVQRIQIWARLGQELELTALADAVDEKVATQVAGMAQLAAGMATLGGNPALGFLSGLSVVAKDRRVTATLRLTRAHLDALQQGAAPAPPITSTGAPPPR